MKKYLLFIFMCFMSTSNGFGMEVSFTNEFVNIMQKSPERTLIMESLEYSLGAYIFDSIEKDLSKIDRDKYPEKLSFFLALCKQLLTIEQMLTLLAQKPFTTKKIMRRCDLDRCGKFYFDEVGHMAPASENDDTPDGPRYTEVEVIDGGGEVATKMAQEIHALRGRIEKLCSMDNFYC